MKTMKLTLGVLLCALTFTNALAQGGKEMLKNAVKYIDIPYVAHTLEADGPEDLVINCDEVDCTTLVEYVLAETLTPKMANGDISEADFADVLRKIRYRDGRIDGYASRLHYIAEWVKNGEKFGFIEDITAQNSSDTKVLSLSYMSAHPQKYKQLANSPAEVEKMKAVEQTLNGTTIHYLPEEKLPNKGLSWIKEGDIIALVTNINGLDVTHMGIAFYADKKLSLLHASSTDGKVVISPVSLSKMLRDSKNWTGIRVLRVKQ